jgi:hypothetical protein
MRNENEKNSCKRREIVHPENEKKIIKQSQGNEWKVQQIGKDSAISPAKFFP